MTYGATVGDRVRTLRLANGLSQTDLARMLPGVADGNALISRIESGRHAADQSLLAALARALQCQVEFLLVSAAEPLATRPLLRAYADASARAIEQVSADNTIVDEIVRRLRLQRVPDNLPAFTGDLNDDNDIELYAEEVRAAADIPSGAVVGNMMRAADRLGLVVLPMPGELGRHLGMSQRIDGVGYIRVSRPGSGGFGVSGDRQRFTVAHEIGHLGLHADAAPPDTSYQARRIERQAHRFASAVLAPAEPLLDDWSRLGGRVNLSVLAELKATWGIAIKALVVRFQQLGIVDDDQATSLYKQISKRGWNKVEPVETTNEQPVWLLRAFQRRYGDTETMRLASNDAWLSELHLQRWVDWSHLAPPAEVVELPRRTTTSSTTPAATGQVVPLPARGR